MAWSLSLVLAVGYLLAGFDKLRLVDMVVEQFASFGYPTWFARVVAGAEVIGAAALLMPRFVVYGAALLGTVMVGAIYTHLTSDYGSPFHASRNLVLLALLAALRWRDRVTAGR